LGTICSQQDYFEQQTELSPRDRATRHASKNRVKRRSNVRQIAFDKSSIARMTFKVIQKSVEMAGIDKPYDTFYQWCVVTTCLSRTISLILPLLRCMWQIWDFLTVINNHAGVLTTLKFLTRVEIEQCPLKVCKKALGT